MGMNDLITSESIENLEINSINCMDSLIDNLSHDMYLGKSLYVGINELPFWIQRFIAQQKKIKDMLLFFGRWGSQQRVKLRIVLKYILKVGFLI